MSAALKKSVRIRKDTPVTPASGKSFPVTPFQVASAVAVPKSDKDDKDKPKSRLRSRLQFDIFRSQHKTEEWNLSTFLKSTLPNMTKDYVEQGLCLTYIRRPDLEHVF